MNTLLYYSGLLAILSVWLFSVAPSLLTKTGRRRDPISHMVFDRYWRHIFNLGLFSTSIFQLVFAYYLLNHFGFGYVPISLGFYVFSLVCLFVAGMVTEMESHRVHALLAKLYVVFTLAGELLFGIELFNIVGTIFIAIPFIAILVSLGIYVKTKSSAYTEYVVIIFSSLWVLGFYLFI